MMVPRQYEGLPRGLRGYGVASHAVRRASTIHLTRMDRRARNQSGITARKPAALARRCEAAWCEFKHLPPFTCRLLHNQGLVCRAS